MSDNLFITGTGLADLCDKIDEHDHFEKYGYHTVEGWHNYVTWSIMLHMANERELYFPFIEWLQKVRTVTPKLAQQYAEGIFNNATPDTKGKDFPGALWENVNWLEISEHWEDMRIENEVYNE